MDELIARLLLNAAAVRGATIGRCEIALEDGRTDECFCGEHEPIDWISTRGTRIDRGRDWVRRPRAEILRGL